MPVAFAMKIVGKPGGTERPSGFNVMTGGTSTVSDTGALVTLPETFATTSE